VFVTGQVGVVAYDAATGAQLWAKSPYQRPTNDGFGQLVVSLDSSTVYIIGNELQHSGSGTST
jgi:hypothetical protein